jgi:hypothetical protein
VFIVVRGSCLEVVMEWWRCCGVMGKDGKGPGWRGLYSR